MGQLFLKTDTEKFIAKRVLFAVGVLSLADFLFVEQRWMTFAGLLCGGIFGILRFCSLSGLITKLLAQSSTQAAVTKSIFSYIINIFVLIVLISASILYNGWFAAGVVTGVLLVPLVIMVNGITEGIGITHNNFK